MFVAPVHEATVGWHQWGSSEDRVARLYKFLPTNFAAGMTRLGCVRIGTLHEYRNSEHRSGISDVYEGTKDVSHRVERLLIEDSEDPTLKENVDYRALGAFNAIKIQNSRNVEIRGVSLSRRFEAPNVFLYCMSEACDPTLSGEFGGADAIVEVKSVQGLIEVLSGLLLSSCNARFEGLFRVSYGKRSESWNGRDWGLHPALLKSSEFRKQAEVRAIWSTVPGTPIAPIVTGDRRLIEHCQVIVPDAGIPLFRNNA